MPYPITCEQCDVIFMAYNRTRQYCSAECSAASKWIEIKVDDEFEYWTIIKVLSKNRLLCRCKCGAEKDVERHSLLRGRSRSCGCLRRESTSKHLMTKTSEHAAWSNMKDRCYNPRAEQFSNYGARGIKVCDRWLGEHGFENFFSDMGPKPTPDHSIDRKDNNGDYTPENCKWATMEEQNNNKRGNRLITHDGVTQTIAQWARSLGVSWTCIDQRLKNGYSIERAVTQPSQRSF